MHFTTFSLYLMSVLVWLSKTSLDHNQFTEKANLCPYIYIVYPHHTEVSLPRQWSERSCICVLGFIDFASFYDFDMWFWNCSDSVVFFVSLFYCRLIEANCDVYSWIWCIPAVYEWTSGADPGGGATGARPLRKKDWRDWTDNRLMLNTWY